MSNHSFSRLKPIIGIVLLLGVLGIGLMSTWYMDHGAMAHQGCVGVSGGMAPCVSLGDITSCLQAHLGVLQGISQVIPTNVGQLLALLIAVVVFWFGFRWRQSEPNALSRLRLRWQSLTASTHVLSEKIGQWLTLHEKRDPAPFTLMVLRVLPVPIM